MSEDKTIITATVEGSFAWDHLYRAGLTSLNYNDYGGGVRGITFELPIGQDLAVDRIVRTLQQLKATDLTVERTRRERVA